jgi:PmbA protein
MEQLLEMTKKVCEQAEVYSVEYTTNSVSFENAKLHDIDSKIQSGLSLRIIKDGKLGFAYTRNLINREEFLQNALDSVEGGVEAAYDFPLTKEPPQLYTYDASIENLSSVEMVKECTRVCDLLKSKTDGEIMATSWMNSGTIRIINTAGTDISVQHSGYGIFCDIIYPGTGSGIWRLCPNKKFEKMPDNLLHHMISLYTSSSHVLDLKGGRMKVLFMPNSSHTLTWRITSGTNSKSVYEKISPVAGKVGEKIFDENLTIYDDPLNDTYPGARAFDDEGIACRYFPLVENGVLKSFYYDLHYAKKLKTKPTGHGYKTAMWGGDVISLKPAPTLTHLAIKPGNRSFAELVNSIDKGIIVEGALGAHSGNIPNGDYSIGANPGIYVENGEIVGRVKDVMVAGNIYETLQQVIAIEDTLHYSPLSGWMPAILCDHVSVATKS